MNFVKYMELKQFKSCLYWLPFQWMFLNLKKFYFVDFNAKTKKAKRTHEAYRASLFSNKYEYLHVIKEVNMLIKILINICFF